MDELRWGGIDIESSQMPQMIDLEGLPEPVAKAIVETVTNLKNRYRAAELAVKPAKDLPSHSGSLIGSARRVEIYDEH